VIGIFEVGLNSYDSECEDIRNLTFEVADIFSLGLKVLIDRSQEPLRCIRGVFIEFIVRGDEVVGVLVEREVS
jgi:hypothetical protein